VFYVQRSALTELNNVDIEQNSTELLEVLMYTWLFLCDELFLILYSVDSLKKLTNITVIEYGKKRYSSFHIQ
jgi:hypothetical protein